MRTARKQEHSYWREHAHGQDNAFSFSSGDGVPLPTEVVRSIGSLWIHCEATGEAPDQGTRGSILMLGYDPVKERFVGTFVATPMTNLWV